MRSTSPGMLALRFLLEVAALVAFGRSAFAVAGWPAAIITPLVAATLWGVFNVPNDPSRSGRAPVPVPGPVRLALEWLFFAGAAASLAFTTSRVLGLALGGAAALLYLVGADRVRWLSSAGMTR